MTMSENHSVSDVEPKREGDFSKVKGGVFLASVGGMAALVGFGSTLAAAKKRDAASFGAGPQAALAEGGVALALRALAWGSFYAVGGVGLLCLAGWKLSGARDLKEFRTIVGSALPRISKKESEGRTEFEGFNDLLEYVISESENKKQKYKE